MFLGDVTFLREYQLVMRPICLALDKLQSEETAYTGILLPTLAMIIKKLHELEKNNEIAVCVPLISVLISSVQNRFSNVFHCVDFELAAVLHPHFRLSWLYWLENGDDEAVCLRKKSRLKNKIIDLLEKELKADERASSSEKEPEDEAEDDFFGSLFENKRSRKGSATTIAETYLEEPPAKNILAAFGSEEKLKLLFIKYNTALPSSAAVERLFSLGKDVLRPKRAGLTDNHFQMLVSLKGNRNK